MPEATPGPPNSTNIGRYAWTPFFVTGLGSAGGGFIAKALLNTGMSVTAARKSALTIAALLMTMPIPAVLTESSGLSIAFTSIAVAGYTEAFAIMLAMPADVFPSEAVASSTAIVSLGSGFGGMIFMLLTGCPVDRYSCSSVLFLWFPHWFCGP